MVRPRYRSGSKQKKRLKTPGGKLKTYHRARKKKAKLECAVCKRKIHGTNIVKSSKTSKRPTRKYPELCNICSREKVKKEALEE